MPAAQECHEGGRWMRMLPGLSHWLQGSVKKASHQGVAAYSFDRRAWNFVKVRHVQRHVTDRSFPEGTMAAATACWRSRAGLTKHT